VADDAVSVLFCNEPAEAVVVGVGFAVVQPGGSPHLVEAGALEDFFGVESGVRWESSGSGRTLLLEDDDRREGDDGSDSVSIRSALVVLPESDSGLN